MKGPSIVEVPLGAVYKDVVVIGNGPSGMSLSHLLSGHWPYYTGEIHPMDEDLTARLASQPDTSLVQQDLDFLAQGLEGRSNNPVSLLFDALNHPCADMGLDEPSLIKWRHHADKHIDHVVLGRGPPGGSWQDMDGNVLTISLAKWMELPGLDLKSYGGGSGPPGGNRLSRASVASLALYYSDYVRVLGLENNFRCGTVVTSVLPNEEAGAPLWTVRGIELGGDEGAADTYFCYTTNNVVLATGNCDRPNKINVPGDSLPYVIYSLSEMENIVSQKELSQHSDPILIVGAGLSAADAIISARFYGIPVIHAFRREASDPRSVFRQLPQNMYPEYHKVYQMMLDGGVSYPGYRAIPQHKIIEICRDKKVRLQSTSNVHGARCQAVKVSLVVALIGAQPDLSFLASAGTDLGLVKGMPIQSRSNTIDINPLTHECVATPGLYALGSLAGDNFVRLVQGGALAITSHLHKQRKGAK